MCLLNYCVGYLCSLQLLLFQFAITLEKWECITKILQQYLYFFLPLEEIYLGLQMRFKGENRYCISLIEFIKIMIL